MIINATIAISIVGGFLAVILYGVLV